MRKTSSRGKQGLTDNEEYVGAISDDLKPSVETFSLDPDIEASLPKDKEGNSTYFHLGLAKDHKEKILRKYIRPAGLPRDVPALPEHLTPRSKEAKEKEETLVFHQRRTIEMAPVWSSKSWRPAVPTEMSLKRIHLRDSLALAGSEFGAIVTKEIKHEIQNEQCNSKDVSKARMPYG
eukprot:GEZU01003908.1.p1 GENE.GEZU01003908.1~~GEZU01003908.1.p1  ORF type:complete len:177 (+),score=14.06 GEZU01003908.1:618-1148(+)